MSTASGTTQPGETPQPGSTWSTTPDVPSAGWSRFERALRAFAFAVVFGVVILALFGVGGLTTATASTTDGTTRLTVFYATVSRPGIATPFRITVEAVGGDPLPAELTLRVPTAYLDMFDENGLDPEPDAVSSDGVTESWTYRPDGTVLSIDFDARIQPNIHWGTSAAISAVAGDAAPLTLTIHTRVMP